MLANMQSTTAGHRRRYCADGLQGYFQYIRHLPLRGHCQDALCGELAPALGLVFGGGYAATGMYPIPILTHDIPGYLITPHTDTRWKGIAVQFYLPHDASTHIGTIFTRSLPTALPKTKQMRFAPKPATPSL